VFVLHDIFRLPFDTIAETIGRSPASCRQLARRARMRITAENAQAGIEVDTVEHRLVTEQFIQACSNGDLSGLLELLDPSAAGGVDLGPADQRTGQIIHGSKRLARTLSHYFGSWTTLVSNPLGGHSVVLAFVEQQLYAVILLRLRADLIQEIHVIADPKKLGFLSKQLSTGTNGDVN
jgi:RNA polymerase sigma-70 factor (ECF subfamily)